jgi:hypothetical protein
MATALTLSTLPQLLTVMMEALCHWLKDLLYHSPPVVDLGIPATAPKSIQTVIEDQSKVEWLPFLCGLIIT